MDFSKLTQKLRSINFDDEPEQEEAYSIKNVKGKKVDVTTILVGDTIRYNKQEYILVDYVDHKTTSRNKMKDPDVVIFNAFNCETTDIEELSLGIDEQVELLKNKDDLYIVEYVIPKIENGKKIMEEGRTMVLAHTKSEVEEKITEGNSKMQITKVEKLIHVKTPKKDE